MTDKHQETVVKPQPSPPSDHTVIQSVRQAQIKVPPIPTIQHMVQDAFDSKASDIHIRVGEVPRFRINGKIYPTKGYPKIKKDLFNSFGRSPYPLPAQTTSPEKRTRYRNFLSWFSALSS